jgi:quinohemoprotein ethanol dehydrogenase
MLAEITVKGRTRKVIMQANKNGFYYVLDRVTGQFISGQPFSQVTWAAGLNEETGRPIVNSEAKYRFDSITLSPGPGGAHNWSPMSFNPATGLVYIPTSAASSYQYLADKDFVYKPGMQNMGVIRPGTQAAAGDAANARSGESAKKLPSPPALSLHHPDSAASSWHGTRLRKRSAGGLREAVGLAAEPSPLPEIWCFR